MELTRALPFANPLARVRLSMKDGPLLFGIAIAGLPIALVVIAAFNADSAEAWRHVLQTRLFSDTLRTLLILLLSGALMLFIGVPTAWLVTAYRFPGRGVFEWLLILPLAAPGYVVAFGYADLMGVAGPIQSWLREVTGWAARDYWFPDIASLPGAAFVLAICLYPYVYLAARAAFVTQSVCTLEAARTLGAGPSTRFFKVALPAARPAIMAGLALALMEVAADYGATSHLGVQTLTVGLFSTWKGFGDAGAAARMAIVLLALVFILRQIERNSRGRGGVEATSLRWRRFERLPLPGGLAAAAAALCATIFILGFVLPIGRLSFIALETRPDVATFANATVNTVLLAGMGTILTFIVALVFALAIRSGGVAGRLASSVGSAGYAVPGAVLALGAIAVTGAMTRWGWISGPTITVGLTALVWVYASRFSAAGSSAIAAALERTPNSMRNAARSLGARPMVRIWRLDLPMAASGALVGGLIIFVEILKELPATLMLRPFDWDTLAVRAFNYASDERLGAAALPCLLITAAGLVPVIILSWRLSRSRPGDAM